MRLTGHRVAAGVVTMAALMACASTNASAATTVRIDVLSNRADLISGGHALVAVTPARAKVSLNGKDVTGQFAVRPDGRYEALLTTLKHGSNKLIARSGKRAASLYVLNHAQGGPVTAGPQIKPWACFEGALDAQCN